MGYQRATKPTQKEHLQTPSSSLPQTSLNLVNTHPLLEPQRTIGNQTVLNSPRSQKTQTEQTTQTFREPRFGHDFSRISIHSTQTAGLQTKLKVNSPGDVYEQEADQVAEQVMRMTNPAPAAPDEEDETKNSLMRKQTNRLGTHATTDTSSAPPLVHEVLNSGGGRPLDARTRAFMEPRFGHDFSRVRVHTDARAAESAQAVNALAYTVGRDVVFGRGQYQPKTSGGQRLLAHELAHVIQQSRVSEVAGYSSYLRSGATESVESADQGGKTDFFKERGLLSIARQKDISTGTGTVTLPTVTVTGNPQFYVHARIRNEYYAVLPPRPHWPYDNRLSTLWLGKMYEDFANVVQNYQVSVMGQSWEQADGIIGPQTAASLASHPIPESAFIDVRAPTTQQDPVRAIRQNSDFVERRVLGVGIFGWGGPFRLDTQINPSTRIPTHSFYLNRSSFDLFADPFTGNVELALIHRIYTSEAEARAAVQQSPFRRSGFTVYAFYRGVDNIIFPTIMSETTTPYLVRTLQAAVAQEQANAAAASDLLVHSFLLAVGLRYPIPLSSGAPAVGRLIIDTGRTLSREELVIAGRLVQEGRVVRAVAEASTPTGDFLVDGVATELKTVSNITAKDVSGSLGRTLLSGGRQAPHVVADTRQQAEVTIDVATRAARRAYGADKLHRIQQIRIIGRDFDITVPRIE